MQQQEPKSAANTKKMSRKWTQEQVDQFIKIYEQEELKGGRSFWLRIHQRMNDGVRKASLVNLQYKWNNYIVPKQREKNIIDPQMIDLLIEQATWRGFLDLTKGPPFNVYKQAAVRGSFFHTMRWMARWIHKVVPQENYQQIRLIISDRHFLQLLAEKEINIIMLRHTLLELRSALQRLLGKKSKVQDQSDLIEHLRKKIIFNYMLIRNLYNSCMKGAPPIQYNSVKGIRTDFEQQYRANPSAFDLMSLPSGHSFLHLSKSNPYLYESPSPVHHPSFKQLSQLVSESDGSIFKIPSYPSISWELKSP